MQAIFIFVEHISIKTLAHAAAPERLHSGALEALKLLYGIESAANGGRQSQVLYFLTGGSEAEAIKFLDRSVFQILLADGKSNAFASAMEVKAYGMQHGYHNVLLCLEDENDKHQLQNYFLVMSALNRLQGKKLGLIGEVSDWLVASTISEMTLKEKLGIDLVRIPWKDAGNYKDFEPGEDFLDCFRAGRQFNLVDAGKVESLLQKLITAHQLDALTVECFSLVQKNSVTACLGLSFLNDLGIPAGCEGDLCSITGMMIAREISGIVPWMANVASIKGSDVLLAHCTAPVKMLSEYHVNTHFETGRGTAIHGRMETRELSIFRLNNTLDKLFYAYGEVVDGIYEKHACRTQLHVRLDYEAVNELRTQPHGNHHLVLPGDWSDKLSILANILGKQHG